MSARDMPRAEGSPEGPPRGGFDPYAQARKALSFRTPFEGDEAAPRVPTLPARLVSWSGSSDGRKKHKKIQPPDETAAEHPPLLAAASSRKKGIWDQFEAYFRPVTLNDVDMLRPKFPFSYDELDPCIVMPFLGSGEELVNKDETFDVAVAETSSYLGVGGEEVISNKERSGQSADLFSNRSAEQGIHEVVVQQLGSTRELSEQSIEQGVREVVVQREEWPLEVEQSSSSGGFVPPKCGEEAGTSINWLLGARERVVLTSERPNKKRKLLGVDAGLEQLVLLPCLGAEAGSICDVCCLGESEAVSNRMLHCNNCKVSMHQKCYGLRVVPDGQWLCAWCKHLELTGWSSKKDAGSTLSMPCVLCPKEKGALKPARGEPNRAADEGNLKFAHLFCSLWTPEVLVEDIESMEPVTNIGCVQENRRKLVCSICKVKHGACIRCSHGACRAAFHPICARESKHRMEIWGKSGHPNVELRAFCSKHSSVGQSNNASAQSPEVRPRDANPGKITKLRFTRKNKDTFMNYEASRFNPDNLIKVKTMEHGALPHNVRSLDTQATRSMEMHTDHPSVGGDLMRNSGDIATLLKKLIESGEVSVVDIASEVGISPASLEAALVGETTTFSHGLKLKIIKWLQNSAHMKAVQDNKLDGSEIADSINLKSSLVTEDKGAAVETSDSAVPEPLPTKFKDIDKILKDKKALCATGTTLENGNMKVLKESADDECFPAEDLLKESTGTLFPVGSNDTSKEVHEELIPNNTSGNKVFDTSMEIPNQFEGTSLRIKTNDLAEAEVGSEVEGRVSSLDQTFSSGENAELGSDAAENGASNHRNCNLDHIHGQPFLSLDDSHSYIHPFIKRKIVSLWEHAFKQNKQTQCHPERLCTSDEKWPVDSSIKLMEATEIDVSDQVSKAKSLGILDDSPDDEVEGEMVFLQARLLDNAIVLKHRYEDLIVKVVHNLSRELDVFSKRKWDFILVNQFLRDVREAKKRGRKEKRHKEAQAVLAAAAAAVAASSRNYTVRKDANDDLVPTIQKSSPKFGAGSSRVAQRTASLPRFKDSSKASNSKVSPEASFGTFHMPIFSKENALCCDVCLRSESVLNRIFVCSRCKAAVHIDCYRNLGISTGPWKCELCEDISSEAAGSTDRLDCNETNLSLVQCGLCHGRSGAFRKAIDRQWIHAFCAEWLLETKYMRGQDNPVDGMETLAMEKDTCCLCIRKVGACLKCNSGDCETTFHPSCARHAGFYMNTKGFGSMLQHKAYCGKHSVEQKETDAHQSGPEEFKSLKRMRVELEKLRLLCERVIKREKVKRETVLCDHDILAKTKDAVVFSYLAPGASSESATTSVNNKSYSGTLQRSDDVTVDSIISGENTTRFSLNNRDADRNTADSSRTLISFKRKLSERGQLAGKQLPQRPVTALQKLEDGKKKTKDKKQVETFQKELVMTSDQASTQNQRLPKGYAYVPRDSLSKEKPWKQNTQTHEPQEPGG
ncbi:uncharacterized protein LOC100826983 isoform X2 [Brachypodium distachyon]|uniref:PHD-type domain-containing protein n=1 Tax=Brachypodium distachyon TaxID=15368 RepID=A0A0Q3FRP7_BRADI|nr:uncharacterized protein LOC100826983 isoform X2 [Brachypodium distachyon]KQK01719.1 hypothetical protein BRADI_3g57770v3 [Brachypodium distachyon]|eukprot:XP_014756555.1 uncharacterized protein LOC100826983 isoform X2 [Brachypodium distachyon]